MKESEFADLEKPDSESPEKSTPMALFDVFCVACRLTSEQSSKYYFGYVLDRWVLPFCSMKKNELYEDLE